MIKTKTITKTEEQLYNQFMAELEEGAKEYDRMMAEGIAPAQKASKPKTAIVSMLRWAAIAACFVGVVTVGIFYFINDNTDTKQLAIVDKPIQKVKAVKEDNTTAAKVVEKELAVIPESKKKVKRFNWKKDIEVKDVDNNVCVLPEIILNVSASKEENTILAQYSDTREEYDFDVVCYNVLPEISNTDNKTFTSAGTEIKQICDNIYYNDVKPLKHS